MRPQFLGSRTLRSAITIALLSAGCDTSAYAPVTVAVHPGAQHCTAKVNETEQPVPCAELGKHLRDVAKINIGRQIDISMFRLDKSHDPKDVDKVAEIVRAAGYADVKVWRFGME